MSAVIKLLRGEPALLTAVAVSIACGLLHVTHATTTQSAAIMAAVAAGGTVATAILAKPVSASLLTGSFTTFLAAVSPFWLHLSTGQTQEIVAGAVSLVTLILRGHVTPTSNAPAS